jgi:hypothetical protein
MLHSNDPNILAIASDAPLDTPLPRFALDDIDDIATFVRAHAKRVGIAPR